MQGILVPELTLGPFLTLSVRKGPNLQSYLFQAYISLNPSRVFQFVLEMVQVLVLELISPEISFLQSELG